MQVGIPLLGDNEYACFLPGISGNGTVPAGLRLAGCGAIEHLIPLPLRPSCRDFNRLAQCNCSPAICPSVTPGADPGGVRGVRPNPP